MWQRPVHDLAWRGFGQAAQAYEQGRPGYPGATVACLVERLDIRPGRRVVDLGAGTGKLTRLLVPTGAALTAVEPVPGMRAEFRAVLPEVPCLDGAAEEIPLEDGAADAVVVAQAFHWFQGETALAEIARVLRPQGRLGLIWNRRDVSLRWVSRLSALLEPYAGDAPRYGSGRWKEAFEKTPLFSPLQHQAFEYTHRLPPDGIIARAASLSFVAALPSFEKEDLLGRVARLLETEPETQGQTEIGFPYRTDVFWCVVRPDGTQQEQQ